MGTAWRNTNERALPGVEMDNSLLIVVKDLSDNTVGRAHCLWLIANELGWETHVVSLTGKGVWAPLASTEFAGCCHRAKDVDELCRYAKKSSLIIAAKPLPTSFGTAMMAANTTGVPLLLDIDDPDLEFGLSWSPIWLALLFRVVAPRTIHDFKWMASMIPQYVTTASNPTLAKRYDSHLVPHVRPDTGVGESSSNNDVVFAGTPRRHKGIAQLRRAIGAIARESRPRLVVTAPAPRDAHPWEQWVGPTSMEVGLGLVAKASMVVVPSLDTVYSQGQLPVKIVDAMMLGTPVVASDLPPIRWALDDGRCGTLVTPGDPDALRKAIMAVLTDDRAREKAHCARARALEMFTPASQMESLRQAYRAAAH